jgi:hypothetical protein
MSTVGSPPALRLRLRVSPRARKGGVGGLEMISKKGQVGKEKL